MLLGWGADTGGDFIVSGKWGSGVIIVKRYVFYDIQREVVASQWVEETRLVNIYYYIISKLFHLFTLEFCINISVSNKIYVENFEENKQNFSLITA